MLAYIRGSGAGSCTCMKLHEPEHAGCPLYISSTVLLPSWHCDEALAIQSLTHSCTGTAIKATCLRAEHDEAILKERGSTCLPVAICMSHDWMEAAMECVTCSHALRDAVQPLRAASSDADLHIKLSSLADWAQLPILTDPKPAHLICRPHRLRKVE